MADHASDIDATPASDEVAAALERVLGSQVFDQAGRATEFLRYVVEETLAGRGDRLKGYTIGIEVFERPEDFDAQSDPLVRVEAGRLRRRLVEYYAAEGRDDPIRIELPRGRYVPAFHCADAETPEPIAAESEAPPVQARPARARRLASHAAILAVGLAGGAWLWLSPSTPEDALDVAEEAARAIPSGPRVLVVPYSNLSGEGDLAYFAYGMTEEIILSLSAFDLLVVVGHTGLGDGSDAAEDNGLRDDYGYGYVLSGSVRRIDDHLRITSRLIDAQTGVQLWTDVRDEDSSVTTLLAIQETIASQVAAAIAVPYGPIFDLEAERVSETPIANLDAYQCVLRFYYYSRFLSASGHEAIVACFERAVVAEPDFAEAWAGLAHSYFDEYRYGYNPRTDRGSPLDRAREAARTALDIDGDSRLANLAMARVRFVDGDLSGFEATARRLLASSPNHPETLALVGTFWAVSGQWDRGLPLVDKALALSSRPPGWFYIAYPLRSLGRGDYDEALDWALRIDASDWYLAPMTVAASAGLAGRPDLAERSLAQLMELRPNFPSEARLDLARWNLEQEVVEAIVDGLRAAGMDIA